MNRYIVTYTDSSGKIKKHQVVCNSLEAVAHRFKRAYPEYTVLDVKEAD